MAQIAPLVTLFGAGASLYATARQAQAQSAQARHQAAAAQAQDAARNQQVAAQQAAEGRAREARLAGTVAAARARLAAGGVQPDEGSAAALTAGLRRDAAAAQADSDAVFSARLAAGRRSLLNDDGSLTPWLRAGTSFGSALRNLLE
jgi:multidrug efflux pump subunit AcrA (membrane-fusion protein)